MSPQNDVTLLVHILPDRMIDCDCGWLFVLLLVWSKLHGIVWEVYALVKVSRLEHEWSIF